MEYITATIESIVFRNDENGYTVFEVNADGSLETAVGTMPPIGEGERVKLGGKWINHATYGKQFKVEKWTKLPPDGKEGIIRYLSSGIIKGVGPATAKKIVDAFGENTIDIIRTTPNKLTSVEGIGKSKAPIIAKALSEHIAMQDNMIFLQSLSIPLNLGAKICNAYGIGTKAFVETYPYTLASAIDGIGFLRADRIARQLDFDMSSIERLVAGISYCLSESAKKDGNSCLPVDILKKQSIKLLNCSEENYDAAFTKTIVNRDLVLRKYCDEEYVYLAYLDSAERQVASKIAQLSLNKNTTVGIDIQQAHTMIKSIKGIDLSDEQLAAVKIALSAGVSVITGGPGTGKTTIINCIIWALEQVRANVILAAPTGRAAKRLSLATNHDASTIHRLLEYGYSEDDTLLSFNKNEENQLDCDTLIIDEMSMVDIVLMQHLLRAVPTNCRLVIVGDADQLPSVSAGNVLHDIINSSIVKVKRLTQIYRQAQESLIVMNAHNINKGQKIQLYDRTSDFFYVKATDVPSIINTLIAMNTKRIPSYLSCDPLKDIQILSPIKKGDLGVFNLNSILQDVFNPESTDKDEKTFGTTCYRYGDKVMQIKNNYNIDWKLLQSNGAYTQGKGVFNGDTGYISDLNNLEQTLTINFDDGKIVEYPFANLDELSLAYAITIHKSQGSEYDVIILPLLNGNPILFTRNLLYTAVTRARKLVVIIGDEATINKMISNDLKRSRYSGLANAMKLQISNDET